MKLCGLIKVCLKETCNEVGRGKRFFRCISYSDGLMQGDALSTMMFTFVFE
jgi:hypothetical protein